MAVPVLMISQAPLSQWSQAGLLRPVPAGTPFWAQDYQVAMLEAAGQAIAAPPGVPVPPPEPGYTVNMVPGLGAASSNCSPPSPWPLPLSVIQAAPTVQAASLTTLSFTTPQVTGSKGRSTLVLCVTTNGDTANPAVSAVTLGGSPDSWQAVVADPGTTEFGAAIWYDPGCAPGQNAVVVNCVGGSGTRPEIYAALYEVPGILTPDKSTHGDSSVSGTAWSSGAAPIALLASEILFGAAMASAAVPVVTGAGTWVTQSTGAGSFDQVAGYQIVSAQSAAQFSGTIPSGGYTALAAGFWRSL